MQNEGIQKEINVIQCSAIENFRIKMKLLMLNTTSHLKHEKIEPLYYAYGMCMLKWTKFTHFTLRKPKNTSNDYWIFHSSLHDLQELKCAYENYNCIYVDINMLPCSRWAIKEKQSLGASHFIPEKGEMISLCISACAWAHLMGFNVLWWWAGMICVWRQFCEFIYSYQFIEFIWKTPILCTNIPLSYQRIMHKRL